MPKIDISIDHKLGQGEAAKRVKDFLNNSLQIPDHISEVSINWQNYDSHFSFRVANITVNGIMSLSNSSLKIESRIPLIFYPLKGQIERIVREYAEPILRSPN